jgi:hypothetical protein
MIMYILIDLIQCHQSLGRSLILSSVYLFVVYLTALSQDLYYIASNERMIGEDELERKWTGAVMA